MFWITLIGIFCGLVSIFFILMEIDRSLAAWEKLTFIRMINPINIIKAWSPVIGDVAITLGLVWMFGMTGMVGMLISLAGSALISGYLYFRRRKVVS